MTDSKILPHHETTLQVATRELTEIQQKIAKLYIDAARRCAALAEIDADLVTAHLSSTAHLSREESLEFRNIAMALGTRKSPLAAHADLLISSGISIPALAALAGTGMEAQQDAIRILNADIKLRADAIPKLRGRRKDWEKRETARRHALEAFASPQLDLQIARLSLKATEIVESLERFHDDWNHGNFAEDDDYLSWCREKIIALAPEALSTFENVFGNGDALVKSAHDDARWLAASYFALRQLSDGRFGSNGALGLQKDIGLGRLSLADALSPLIAYDENWSEAPGKLTVFELCAGAGGMSLGLQAAGFEHVGLFDRNAEAIQSLKANQEHWPAQLRDVMKLTDHELRKFADVDLLAAGLPCCPFEKHSRKPDLFPRMIEIIRVTKPRAFILENDAGARKKDADSLARSGFLKAISSEEYEVDDFQLDTAEFGLPHSTTREFFVGIRKDIPRIFERPRIMTDSVEKIAKRKASGSVDWLEMAPGHRRGIGDVLTEVMSPYETRNNRDTTDQQRKYNDWAQHWRDLYKTKFLPDIPEKQDKAATGKAWKSAGLQGPWAVENPPSVDEVTGKEFIPRVTFAALAVAQGFPAKWQFAKTENGKLAMIQAALPPVLSRMVGLAVRTALTGENFDMDDEVKATIIEDARVGPQPAAAPPRFRASPLRRRRRLPKGTAVNPLPRNELYYKAVRVLGGEYPNEVERNHTKRGELKAMMKLVQEEWDRLRLLEDDRQADEDADFWASETWPEAEDAVG